MNEIKEDFFKMVRFTICVNGKLSIAQIAIFSQII